MPSSDAQVYNTDSKRSKYGIFGNTKVRIGINKDPIYTASSSINWKIDNAAPENMDPTNAAKQRAFAFVQQGRLPDATVCFQQALLHQPDDPDTHGNLGIILLHLGRLDEAALHFREGLRLQPENAEFHFNLGVVLHKNGRLDDAAAAYRQALQRKPDHVDALNNLASTHLDKRQLTDAAATYRQVLSLKPDHVDAQTNLGIALMELGQLDEAASCYRRALQLEPNLADAHNGLGAVFMKQGNVHEALAAYEQALRLEPGHADTHLNRGLLWLLLGQWTTGWPEYEWRWRTPAFPRHGFRQPRWDGSPLAGRTLLVVAEQGLGDTLQFVRYLALPELGGGKVVFRCQKQLRQLLCGCSWLPNLAVEGEPLGHFDIYAPLLSLPGILGTTPANIPAAIPYLQPPASLVERWRLALASPLRKIGIAWQGSTTYKGDSQRSIPLRQFAPLAALPGVELISLQKGPGTDQLRALAGQFAVVDPESQLGDDSESFTNLAAIMKNLDLVISCDTAPAHLAGAGRCRLGSTAAGAGLALAAPGQRQPVVSDDAALPSDASGRLG